MSAAGPHAGRSPCAVCGEARVRVLARLVSELDGESYDAVRCPSCGLLFADPLPTLTQDSLQKIYGDAYTREQREPTLQAEEMLRRATDRQMQIVERHVEPGRALNVGAMSGASRVFVDRGWKLRVLDVSEHAAATARTAWGVDVSVARIEDFDPSPEKFDFVKLGHVIEHLAEPRRALENVARMVRPGGIVLIDTDNAGGLRSQVEFLIRSVVGERLAARLVRLATGKNLGNRYGRLIPPIHLNIFTERSLVELLRSTGFDVLEVQKPAWGDPTWFPMTRTPVRLAERVAMSLDRFGAAVGRGEVLAVLARRFASPDVSSPDLCVKA